MSNGGAYEDEMGRFLRLNDRDLDRLLAGHAPAEEGDLDELAQFFRELTHTFQAAPEAPTETRHLTAIMEAVRLLPAAGATSSAAGHEPVPPAPQKRRLGGRSWIARAVLTAILALGLFSGVAYAGALPGPVQGAVADVARNLGVSLPGAHNDKNDGAQNDKHNGEQNNVQTDTNSGVQSNGGGTQNNGNGGTQNKGSGHGNQNGNSEGSQHGSSGAQNDTNEGGTKGASGNDGSATFNQGPSGNLGATARAGQGNGTQANGTQGNGDN